MSAPSVAQSLHLALSPLQILSQNVGKTNVKITYSRPALRGRKIFGALHPYNQKWRTGANRNSKIQFSEDVVIDGKNLEAGTYGIFTKPMEDKWEVYFYSDTTYWEVPRTWNDSLVAVQLSVPSTKLHDATESMTFSVDNIDYTSCEISLTWENTRIRIPVEMHTEKQMMSAINKVLNGPRSTDYNTAAAYRLESGQDLEQGLEWIDKAIAMRTKASFYDHLVKAKLLAKMDKPSESRKFAQKSKELAIAINNTYGVELVEHFLKTLD